jgi:hypothetical protein
MLEAEKTTNLLSRHHGDSQKILVDLSVKVQNRHDLLIRLGLE